MLYFKLYLFAIFIVLLFSLYQSIYIIFNDKVSALLKLVAFVVLVSLTMVGLSRNTYLPFLGPMAIPSSVLKDDMNLVKDGVTFKIPVDMEDNTKVVYWASQPSKKVFEDPWTAYGDYSNAGVTYVKNKEAVFVVQCPSSYNVKAQTLKPHIHYRIVYPKGILGEIKTAYVKC